MLSVSIFMNGNPIYTRTVVNISRARKPGPCVYKLDDGQEIVHDPDDGAVPLAIKMLKTIHEVK